MKTTNFLSILFIIFLLLACNKEYQNSDKLPQLFIENFDNHTGAWTANYPQNWRIINDNNDMVYYLFKPGPQGSVRAPTSRAVLDSVDVTDFELIVRAKCLTDTLNSRRDVCLFFGYQDSLHYYYAHFAGTSDNVHNVIAIVNNADRAKINLEPAGTSKAILTGEKWYTLKIKRRSDTGLIQAFIEDMDNPVMTAGDKTFLHGKIGLGSFDDPAQFTSVELNGHLYKE
ncbi:hypothetical protein JXQ31_15625 [candidate division KSB1 bacterium]|nr:hypothetical protein [candidate division KSB1 bacterium]